ncbi:MAG: T9SS type A sorting domain-containing protein [Bacteroidia bacterium]|nr:T9SS type A sorting domain-containing protein [Bacteroidia bacterium]
MRWWFLGVLAMGGAKAQSWEALSGPPGARAFSMLESDGILRLATGNGVYRYQTDRWILERSFGFNANQSRANAVYDLAFDAPGVYLAAVDTGLFRVQAAEASLLTVSLGRIAAVKVRKFDGGIYLLCRNPDRLYRSDDGRMWQIVADQISDFETSDGVWTLAKEPGGIRLFKNQAPLYWFENLEEAKIYVENDRVAVAASNGLWTSDDGGLTFSLTGPNVAVCAYSFDGYLAAADGVVYRQTTSSWSPVFAMPVAVKINAIIGEYLLCDDFYGVYRRQGDTFVPFNDGLRNVVVKTVGDFAGTVYAFVPKSGVFVSGSGGTEKWDKAGTGLPFIDADELFVVGARRALLFSSLFKALYITENRGALWTKVENFPPVANLFRLSDGKFYACDDTTIYISTDGRQWQTHSKPGVGFAKTVSRAGDTLFIVRDGRIHYYDGLWKEYPTPGIVWGGKSRFLGKNRLEFALTRPFGIWYRKNGSRFDLELNSVFVATEFAGGEKILVYTDGKLYEYRNGERFDLDFVSPHWATAVAYSSDGKRIYVGTLEDGLYALGEATRRNPAFEPQILRVYPNPARHELYVEGAYGDRVSIWSLSGMKVCEAVLAEDRTRLDVSSLPPGAYCLKIGDAAVRFLKTE